MRRALKTKQRQYRSLVIVNTGAGHGGTNTKIRRIETAQESYGKDITVTHSANDGTSFKINSDGIYSINYSDGANIGIAFGISRNSAELTTAGTSITASTRLAYSGAPANTFGQACWSGPLKAGDIIRPHTEGDANNNSAAGTIFSIAKIGA